MGLAESDARKLVLPSSGVLNLTAGCSSFAPSVEEFNTEVPGTTRLRGKDGSTWWLTPPPRGNTLAEQILAVSVFCSWFVPIYLAPIWVTALLYFAVSLSPTAWTIIALITAASFVPAGKEWKAFRRSKLWETWQRYFHMQYITRPLPYLQPGRQYIFAQFPHATYPFNAWLAMTFAGKHGSGSPDNIKGAIASIFFSIPLIRHNYAWVGCTSADKDVILKTLKTHSVACLPEGIAGIFTGASPTREAVYLKNRKGFVKVAIQAGVDLVPMYTLGQSQLLTFKGNEKLSRACRASIGIWWGWRGLPVPRPHKLITIVGSPIPVKQADNPSQSEVDDLHAKFVQAIRDMYMEHRGQLGWEHRPLEII